MEKQLCIYVNIKFFFLSSMDLETYLLGNEAKTCRLSLGVFIIMFLLKYQNFIQKFEANETHMLNPHYGYLDLARAKESSIWVLQLSKKYRKDSGLASTYLLRLPIRRK